MSTVPPVYDEAYYSDYDGQRYERSDAWLGLFRHFADNIVKTLQPSRTLDAGCALGFLVEALDELGVESYGFDISEYAISQVTGSLGDRCWAQTLTDPLEGRYDLVTCIEVIEHLPATEVVDAVTNLCSVTDMVLLSSTPTEHEEPTHLNVQPPEYWSALFAARGFFRDTDFDASFISPWAVLYRRRDAALPEVVRSYDRAWWRLKDENTRVRQSLLDAVDAKEALAPVLSDDEWDTIRASDDPTAELTATAARVRAEREGRLPHQVEALREQLALAEGRLLTMRDELIGAQRRAGESSGRAAELEAELWAHAPLREQYEQMVGQRDEARAQYEAIASSTSWRITQKALAPYRRLRGITPSSQS